MIYSVAGHRSLAFDEFISLYTGCLMFIYRDRYGLPLKLMLKILDEK